LRTWQRRWLNSRPRL